MNKAKTVFWIVVFGIILLIFFQNDAFFLDKQSIQLNLLFFEYQSPKVHNAVIFLAFFLAGLLVSYFLGIPERFRLKKTVKHLTAQLNAAAAAAEAQPPPPEPEAKPEAPAAVEVEAATEAATEKDA